MHTFCYLIPTLVWQGREGGVPVLQGKKLRLRELQPTGVLWLRGPEPSSQGLCPCVLTTVLFCLMGRNDLLNVMKLAAYEFMLWVPLGHLSGKETGNCPKAVSGMRLLLKRHICGAVSACIGPRCCVCLHRFCPRGWFKPWAHFDHELQNEEAAGVEVFQSMSLCTGCEELQCPHWLGFQGPCGFSCGGIRRRFWKR